MSHFLSPGHPDFVGRIVTLDPRDRFRQPYQNKFLKTLTPDSSRHFVHTRELQLHFSLGPASVSDTNQCCEIQSMIDIFVRIYEYAEHYIKGLVVKVEPFVPADCMNESLWPLLNNCNDIIYHCLGLIAHRETDFEMLVAEIGREAWGFDIEYRPHLQQMLWLLAVRITTLEINESPFFINNWLPAMQRLRSLTIKNVGGTSDDDLMAMWSAISGLRLRWLALSGFKCPPNIQRYLTRTLTSLFLIGLDDVVSACVVCFTQMPQLERCTLNAGTAKYPKEDATVVIGDTVCTKLFQVLLYESPVPVGLVSVIAKKNPRLAFCGAPPNISDEDMFNLRNHCPRLRALQLSCNLDSLPSPRLTQAGLAEVIQMPALQSLRLHASHVHDMNRQFMLAIASKCILLHSLRFTIPMEQQGGREWGKEDVRASLHGSTEFRDWFVDLWRKRTITTWEISISSLREKPQ